MQPFISAPNQSSVNANESRIPPPSHHIGFEDVSNLNFQQAPFSAAPIHTTSASATPDAPQLLPMSSASATTPTHSSNNAPKSAKRSAETEVPVPPHSSNLDIQLNHSSEPVTKKPKKTTKRTTVAPEKKDEFICVSTTPAKMDQTESNLPLHIRKEAALLESFQKREKSAKTRFPTIPGTPYLVTKGVIDLPSTFSSLSSPCSQILSNYLHRDHSP
jgi:hypothetical protein